MKIKLLLLVTFCFVSISQAVAQSKTIALSDLTGTYTTGHKYGGSAISINSDGTYQDDSGDCTNEYNQSGTFTFDSNTLHFTILKYTTNGHGDTENIVDLLDPTQSKEFFHTDKGEMEKTFQMIPIKWSDRTYLLYKDALEDFCNAVNLGIEPRTDLSSKYFFGSFYLRNGDETVSVTDKPLLPAEWNSFLLKNSVTANIIAINGEKQEKIATINKGSLDGLKIGMQLVGKDEEPSLWSGEKIVSVDKKTATVRIFDDLKIGDKLSTKFVAPTY